jgi:hypothetical protein
VKKIVAINSEGPKLEDFAGGLGDFGEKYRISI